MRVGSMVSRLRQRLRTLWALSHHPLVEMPRPALYLGNNTALTVSSFGHKFLLDTRDISITPHVLLNGIWEPDVTAFLMRQLSPGMVVLDIGANFGWYTILAASLVGSGGRVFSFEAHPELADLVFHNVGLNGMRSWVTVENKAVHKESGRVTFGAFERYKGGSSIYIQDEHAALVRDRRRTFDVDSVSLDEYFSDGQAVDFIRIDVEGTEPIVFEGARRLLERNPNIRILMEFSPVMIDGNYGSTRAFLRLMSGFGFSWSKVGSGGELVPVTEEALLGEHLCEVFLRRS